MEYSNRMLASPKAFKTSQDRFCLSPAKTSCPKFNLTPERTPPRPRLPLSPNSSFSYLSSQDKLRNQRYKVGTPLYHCQSQDVLQSSPSRRSSIKRDSLPSSPSSNKGRVLPTRPTHKIDMEDITDDFYIHPIDWSRRDVIALALNDDFVLVNPKTAEINVMEDAPLEIQSVKFNKFGNIACLGCADGSLNYFDVQKYSLVHSNKFNDTPFVCSEWEDNVIYLGGRTGNVALVDSRDYNVTRQFNAHMDEICSIQINPFNSYFATGANNSVKIWDQRNFVQPVVEYTEHQAAVRALCWSPNAADIIATGGGSGDKLINIWNSQTGETVQSVDTGSQVCNLFWNDEYNEIVSTHGYSQNHIAIWKGTDLCPVGSFMTHATRILYMAHSYDGTSIATASVADSLQIWKVFPRKQMTVSESLLLLR